MKSLASVDCQTGNMREAVRRDPHTMIALSMKPNAMKGTPAAKARAPRARELGAITLQDPKDSVLPHWQFAALISVLESAV